MSLDGALDSGDLQSFAYQIANGMVSRFIFQSVMTNFLTGVSSYHTSRLVIVFSLTV